MSTGTHVVSSLVSQNLDDRAINPTPPAGQGGVYRASKSGTIEIAVAQAATTDSTQTLPAGAKVRNCQIVLGTQYSVGGTITVGQVGALTAFMATTDNNPQGTAGDIDEKIQRTAVDAGSLVVRVTVGGAPAAGACTVVIFYDTPAT